MSTISTTTPRNANMINTIALAIVLVALLAFVVAQSVTAPKAAVISVAGSQDVNSATQSYIAWAEATDSERTVLDSATRSYVAQAKAACSVDATYSPNLDSATRSYIAWGFASDIGALCR